jgi:hypothetical protein
MLVSQKYDEIYVAFAQYDNDWLEYLNSNTVTPGNFMHIYQFGPYRIDNAKQMAEVAPILLASLL